MALNRNNFAFTNAGVAGAFQDSFANTIDDSDSETNLTGLSYNDASDDDGTDVDDQDFVDYDDNDAGDDIDVGVSNSGNYSVKDITTDVDLLSGNDTTIDTSDSIEVSGSGNHSYTESWSSSFSDTDTFNFSDDDVTTVGSNNTSTTDISDSYNSVVTGSGNFDLDATLSFDENIDDADLIDIEGLNGRLEDIYTLDGDGNIFALDQVQSMVDVDYINNPTVGNFGYLDQGSYNVDGGEAYADSGWGSATGASDVSADSSASADAVSDLDAFNQTIAMGANVQYASVDLDVIGGGSSSDLMGDDT